MRAVEVVGGLVVELDCFLGDACSSVFVRIEKHTLVELILELLLKGGIAS